VLFDEAGRVAGVATGDMGVGTDGQPTERYQAGMELRARYTLLAEGCRGSLSKFVINRFGLAQESDPRSTASASRNCGRWRPGSTSRAR